jgi:hypothetical protein
MLGLPLHRGRLPALATHLVLAGVDEKSIQPAVEARRLPQPRKVTPSSHKRVLSRILRSSAVAEDEPGRGDKSRKPALYEGGERLAIAGSGSDDELHAHGVAVAEKLFAQTADLPLGAVFVAWLARNFDGMKFADLHDLAGDKRNAKAIVGLLGWKLPLQQAIDLPNVIARGDEYFGEVPKLAPGVAEALAARGVDVEPGRGEESGLHGLVINADGSVTGAADPRREGVWKSLP